MSRSSHGSSFLDIQAALNGADFTGLPELNIAVLRNVMLEPLEAYLRHGALALGFNASVRFGEYDNVFQEAVGGQPELLSARTDCVLVFLRLETLSPDLAYRHAGLDRPQADHEIRRVEEHVCAVLRGIRAQTQAMILWHGFETPRYPSMGIIDTLMEGGQLAAVRRLNECLRRELRAVANAYLVEMDQCALRVGAANFHDERFWHIGRAPYTLAALQEIASEDLKFLRAAKGKNKKCLVLDCDNTLWGGVIGEDGLAGIQLGPTHPGSYYRAFQQAVLNLHHRGVILCLLSKNNARDVWEVFESHAEMILRREHISAAQISWQDKASGLHALAQELNIGLDSMVLVDDSDFEVNLVRQELPEVEVLHMPPALAAQASLLLISCGLFDTLTVSEEDRNRGRMYQAETERKRLRAALPDMGGYLRSLEMAVAIRSANGFTAPRIAQLTQKTNQFNLTTRRHSEEEILAFMSAPEKDVISLRLSDRFGDSGIVGVCILRYSEDLALLDSFLLSCRVLGRGVEDLFLDKILERARARGARQAIGLFRPTSKNEQVASFYSERGFTPMGQTPEAPGAEKRFALDLLACRHQPPAHASLVLVDFTQWEK